jgi:hypothetical protein
LSLVEDAAVEGMSPGEYKDRLKESSDPRLAIYEILTEINKPLSEVLWPQILRTRESRKQSHAPAQGSAEDVGTKAVTQRRSQVGDKGKSDKDERLPVAEREKELREELVAKGIPESEAKPLAVDYVKSNVKFLFQEAEIPGTAMFDVSLKGGTIIILINSRHPAREHCFDLPKK